MRGRRGLLIAVVGMGACLVAGCLRVTLPAETRKPRTNIAAHAKTQPVRQLPDPDPAPSDYLVSQEPSVKLEVQTPASPGKPVEPVEMRMKEESSPPPPADPPEPRMEVHPVPPKRTDAPPVQVLRALLEHHPEEEIKEQLQSYDEATRQTILLMLQSVAQLEQGGSLDKIAPRDLAAWIDRVNTLTGSLRCRAQLILDKMCFCSQIKKFGDFAPLPAEHTAFQPGEVAHIYVQALNCSSRREQEKYLTLLKGRVEIYEEHNRAEPFCTYQSSLKQDFSATARQDFFINFRFEIPHKCPPGLYTVRITIEDWTDAPPEAKKVPESRIAQRTLDIRVSGLMYRSSRTRLDENASSP